MQLFNTNTLLGTARRNTGLTDFGPDDFMPGLNALIDGINAKAEISEDRWGNLFDFLSVRWKIVCDSPKIFPII